MPVRVQQAQRLLDAERPPRAQCSRSGEMRQPGAVGSDERAAAVHHRNQGLIRADLPPDAEARAQDDDDGRAARTAHAHAFGYGARLDVVPWWQRRERGVERGAGALVQLQAYKRGITHARKMRSHDAVMLAFAGRTGPPASRRHGERLERARRHDSKGNGIEARHIDGMHPHFRKVAEFIRTCRPETQST